MLDERQWAGRYRLEEVLGRGSMGVVWRARDELLGRDVAVKLLPPEVDSQESIPAARLLQEAHALAQIEHPNVVRILDSARSKGQPFLVMELLAGRTLSTVLADTTQLAEPEIRDIWAQLCEGVRAIHRAGVVHRDLKPGNVIRLHDGMVKLTDFGLAFDGWSDRLTTPGTFVGTVAYAAPERIRGSDVDVSSDLYSLGCILFELLCGRPPFVGDAAAQTYGHVHRTPSPPSAFRSGVPSDLELLAMSLLTKDPAARVAAWDGDAPTLDRRLPDQPQSRPRSRRRTPVTAVFSVTVALLLVAWMPGGLGEPRRTAAPSSTTRPVLPSGDSSVSVFRTAEKTVITPAVERPSVRDTSEKLSSEPTSVAKKTSKGKHGKKSKRGKQR